MESVIELLNKYNQENLVTELKALNSRDRENFKAQIEKIDFEFMKKLYANAKKDFLKVNKSIHPIDNVYIKKNIEKNVLEEWEKLGIESIKNGEFAVVTMAGGQGTRLGHDKPKGTYILDVCGKKMSIFEILLEKLKSARTALGVSVPWYIMTSRENNRDTIDFFETNNYFGYGKENIMFFEQAELPMQDMQGNIVLESKGKIKFAANGNGGVFKAVCDNVLDNMKTRGIKYIYFSGVDNILVNFVDSIFLGGIICNGFKAGSKSILKEYPQEKVGVICSVNGKATVIEYSELPQDMASLAKQNGELMYSEANIVSNIFSIDIIKRGKELPYHVATKNCDMLMPDGTISKGIAYKYEMFIFDIYNLLGNLFVLRVERCDEFAPVKNKEGVDSPQTATKLYNEFKSKNK